METKRETKRKNGPENVNGNETRKQSSRGKVWALFYFLVPNWENELSDLDKVRQKTGLDITQFDFQQLMLNFEFGVKRSEDCRYKDLLISFYAQFMEWFRILHIWFEKRPKFVWNGAKIKSENFNINRVRICGWIWISVRTLLRSHS